MASRPENNDEQSSSADVLARLTEQWDEMLSRTATSWPASGADSDSDATSHALSGIAKLAAQQARLDPARVMEAQLQLWRDQQQLWMDTTTRLLRPEVTTEPVIEPDAGDRRFRDPEWDEHPAFAYLKQSYLLNAAWLERMVNEVKGLDADTAQKIGFFNRQLVNALAPTNFALTNPSVRRQFSQTKGESLARGLQNLERDLGEHPSAAAIRQTDPEAFAVGENIAVSPGAVVFQNELFQLIQYAPTTDTVHKRPVLIVPPWINKYYILDLRPENSFVKWCTEQRLTVFVISWVNPDARYRDKGFDDYVRNGVLAALGAIEQATNERQITAIGYCIGGTLLAATLAYLAACGDEDRIVAAAFFAAQVDFEEGGELRVFTDEAQVEHLEAELMRDGYLDGHAMATVFNLLRANDLIWHFVVNNYLMGKSPRAFDLLHWNADSTRFPARLLLEYLRGMYQENQLARPNAFKVLGIPIDLSKVKTPAYVQAAKEDHIAPARSVFKALSLFSGPRRFVLASSGHVAGVINPPHEQRHRFWTNAKRKRYQALADWLGEATENSGSWWPDWQTWIAKKSGPQVPARVPGAGTLPALEPAPGSYVKVRC